MPERYRAMLGDQMVTIIDLKGTSKNSDVEIRDQFGYTRTVKRKDLKLLDKRDEVATFEYQDHS